MLNQEEINSVEKTPLNLRNPEFKESSYSCLSGNKDRKKPQFFPNINEINISKPNLPTNLSVSNSNFKSKNLPLSLASPKNPKSNNFNQIYEKEDTLKYNHISPSGKTFNNLLHDNEISSFNYIPIINPLLISGYDNKYLNQDKYKTTSEFNAKEKELIKNQQLSSKEDVNGMSQSGKYPQCLSNNESIDKNEEEIINNAGNPKFNGFSMKNWNKINKRLQRKFSQEYIKNIEINDCLGKILPLKLPENKKDFITIKNYFNLTRPKFLKRKLRPKNNKEINMNVKEVKML